MSPRCRDKKSERGFTLIELTISMTILVVVLVLSMTLLFSMKNFAQRQRQFAEPRQNARRAMDYISGYIRSATDGNFIGQNPNAFVMWWQSGGVPRQASFNNVTDGSLAEPGTDILTFGRGIAGARIRITQWNGPNMATSSAIWCAFAEGCPNNNNNMALFEQASTCINGPDQACDGSFPCPGCQSGVLSVVDSQGNWAYMQITGYQQSDCSDTDHEIHLIANPGQSAVNPPSNRGVSCTLPTDCSIGNGVQYIAFRVRQDPTDVTNLQFQQKNGLFDPTTDNPGNAFFPLLDNIEDFQVAYIYNTGLIFNDGANQLLAQGCTGGVPNQASLGSGTAATDITNVVGIRISVVSRANTPVSLMERAKFFRPGSEDRDEDPNTDRFYHYRLTTTVMVRNRNLGG